MKKAEILKKESEFEKEGRFSEHIVPPFKKVKEVTTDYEYIRKGFFKKAGSFFAVLIFRLAGVFIAPYCKLKIIGKENLKEAKRAIITSNHINDIDCVLLKHAVSGKRLKIVVAKFNNPTGILGAMLRAGGTLPLGENVVCMKNMGKAITHYLNRNNFVLFYPEGSEWWCYEKPRPFIKGAYYFAVKNNVPIIPAFFTFEDYGKEKNGVRRKKFYLHIGKALYPDQGLPEKQRIEDLKDKNYEYCKEVYERFYGKELVFETVNL